MFSSRYKTEESLESFNSQTMHAGKSANVSLVTQLNELSAAHSLSRDEPSRNRRIHTPGSARTIKDRNLIYLEIIEPFMLHQPPRYYILATDCI